MASCRALLFLVIAIAVAVGISFLVTRDLHLKPLQTQVALVITAVGCLICCAPICCICTACCLARQVGLSVVAAVNRARTRRPCLDATHCTVQDRQHHRNFSHPGDDDYGYAVRCHGGTPQFCTLRQCFNYMDPNQLGYVKEVAALNQLLRARSTSPSSDRLKYGFKYFSFVQWGQLFRTGSFSEVIFRDIDTDGNGYISFPEWIEWASLAGQAFGFPSHIGIVNDSKTASLCAPCTVTGCPCEGFRFQNGPGDVYCTTPGCAHYSVYHVPSPRDQLLATLPAHWSLDTSGSQLFRGKQRVACGTSEVQQIQRLMDASIKTTWTRDRGQKPVPKGYEVVRVERNENVRVWSKYVLKRALMTEALGQTLKVFTMRTSEMAQSLPMFEQERPDAALNEWFLWHGASSTGAVGIAENEFKQSYAGSNVGTLYGRGTYLSDSCTKADEYAREAIDGPDEGLSCLVLCRVMGGKAFYCDEAKPNPDNLERAVLEGEYDSIFGDREKCRNTFKEIVIYESTQAYPEYLVYYRRTF